MKAFSFSGLIAVLLIAIVFTGCKKEKVVVVCEDYSTQFSSEIYGLLGGQEIYGNVLNDSIFFPEETGWFVVKVITFNSADIVCVWVPMTQAWQQTPDRHVIAEWEKIEIGEQECHFYGWRFKQ
jgi:hypothetical protein